MIVPSSLREAHRHAGAGEHARPVLHPRRRPVVVVRVEPDAVRGLDLGLRAPVAPRDAVRAVRRRRRDAREGRGEVRQLASRSWTRATRGPVGAVGVDVQRHLEAEAVVELGLRVGERGAARTRSRSRARTPSRPPSSSAGLCSR